MKIFFALPVLYIAAYIYLFVRLFKHLKKSTSGIKILVCSIFWAIVLSMFLSFFGSFALRDADLPAWLCSTLFIAGSTWMVFTLYMVLLMSATEILRIFRPLRPFISKYGLICSAGFTLLLLLYGHINYRNPKINEINIPSNRNIRIIAISDVHLGYGTGKKLLRKYVQKINSLSADMILIGGDLIDNSVDPLYRENMAEQLSQLKAPMGIYMVPGNHEYISGINKVEAFIKQTPIILLRDSVVQHPCGVTLIGRDDRHLSGAQRERKSLEELVAATRSREDSLQNPIILIEHQPYNLAKADSLNVTLQFSGHTHRGQIWPVSLLVDKLYEQSHGYRKWKNSHIYVSSGLSLWGPPFRIGTESEIVVINLL